MAAPGKIFRPGAGPAGSLRSPLAYPLPYTLTPSPVVAYSSDISVQRTIIYQAHAKAPQTPPPIILTPTFSAPERATNGRTLAAAALVAATVAAGFVFVPPAPAAARAAQDVAIKPPVRLLDTSAVLPLPIAPSVLAAFGQDVAVRPARVSVDTSAGLPPTSPAAPVVPTGIFAEQPYRIAARTGIIEQPFGVQLPQPIVPLLAGDEQADLVVWYAVVINQHVAPVLTPPPIPPPPPLAFSEQRPANIKPRPLLTPAADIAFLQIAYTPAAIGFSADPLFRSLKPASVRAQDGFVAVTAAPFTPFVFTAGDPARALRPPRSEQLGFAFAPGALTPVFAEQPYRITTRIRITDQSLILAPTLVATPGPLTFTASPEQITKPSRIEQLGWGWFQPSAAVPTPSFYAWSLSPERIVKATPLLTPDVATYLVPPPVVAAPFISAYQSDVGISRTIVYQSIAAVPAVPPPPVQTPSSLVFSEAPAALLMTAVISTPDAYFAKPAAAFYSWSPSPELVKAPTRIEQLPFVAVPSAAATTPSALAFSDQPYKITIASQSRVPDAVLGFAAPTFVATPGPLVYTASPERIIRPTRIEQLGWGWFVPPSATVTPSFFPWSPSPEPIKQPTRIEQPQLISSPPPAATVTPAFYAWSVLPERIIKPTPLLAPDIAFGTLPTLLPPPLVISADQVDVTLSRTVFYQHVSSVPQPPPPIPVTPPGLFSESPASLLTTQVISTPDAYFAKPASAFYPWSPSPELIKRPVQVEQLPFAVTPPPAASVTPSALVFSEQPYRIIPKFAIVEQPFGVQLPEPIVALVSGEEPDVTIWRTVVNQYVAAAPQIPPAMAATPGPLVFAPSPERIIKPRALLSFADISFLQIAYTPSALVFAPSPERIVKPRALLSFADIAFLQIAYTPRPLVYSPSPEQLKKPTRIEQPGWGWFRPPPAATTPTFWSWSQYADNIRIYRFNVALLPQPMPGFVPPLPPAPPVVVVRPPLVPPAGGTGYGSRTPGWRTGRIGHLPMNLGRDEMMQLILSLSPEEQAEMLQALDDEEVAFLLLNLDNDI